MAKARQPASPVVFESPTGVSSGTELDQIVLDVIGRVADKWTMLVLEVLSQHGVLRFTRIGQLVGGISQRMLTKTLRQMEDDGYVIRTVYPEVPPRVDYRLTELGESLCAAFCGVWTWAETHRDEIEARRAAAKTKA
jgi:DNA-binding HxlR family transcriptional regulator